MFGFDGSIPLQNLVGQTVWWVCFSVNGARIILRDGDAINIFDRKVLYQDNAKFGDWTLISLAGEDIESINIKSGSRITISFKSGILIDLFDRFNDFENYEFTISGSDYIV
jgi:hypothetical protein